MKDVKVNLRADVGPEEAVIPWLKPGQSVNNVNASGRSASWHIGFPNGVGDCTIGLSGLTRLPYFVEQLQTAERHPGEDVEIGLRSMLEYDAHELLSRYLAKGRRVGEGPVAKWRTVEEIAATFVGVEHAPALAAAWDQLERSFAALNNFQTGGNFILLATIHQRWLTRPLTAFPSELTGEDRDYWRDYLFQAQDEASAMDYVDLQAHKWLSGYAGLFLVNNIVFDAQKDLNVALAKAKALLTVARTDAAAKYLKGVVLKLRLFKAVATTLRSVKSATVNDWSAICWYKGKLHQSIARPGLEIYDRVGGGDSFASGLIYGFMAFGDAEKAVNYGAAHGALAMTTPGDTSMATKADVEKLVGGGSARVDR